MSSVRTDASSPANDNCSRSAPTSTVVVGSMRAGSGVVAGSEEGAVRPLPAAAAVVFLVTACTVAVFSVPACTRVRRMCAAVWMRSASQRGVSGRERSTLIAA